MYFLPIRSPNRPKNNAPNGRTINPAAKMAKVLINADAPASAGNNCDPIIRARLPKI
ncbi:hypothetical protein D3C80_1334980 [compost metagenome]